MGAFLPYPECSRFPFSPTNGPSSPECIKSLAHLSYPLMTVFMWQTVFLHYGIHRSDFRTGNLELVIKGWDDEWKDPPLQQESRGAEPGHGAEQTNRPEEFSMEIFPLGSFFGYLVHNLNTRDLAIQRNELIALRTINVE
ncbi:hypothetical protein CEXT_38001 [Caerostris extrusa]|uniref:Uncharacterized protein n=1 Tax=Caerostris extrusa TaxID=172846 RepID=A0AAV4TH94_CAEEX|nr:hypothetical protein CEXT_38001 [Caerostris extrusa]